MEAFINEMVEPRVFDLIMLILPKWRLLVYIFLMNIVIFTPVYAFGALVSNEPDLPLICPPVLLIGFNLVHRALFRFGSERNTRQLLLGVAILGLGISASGLVAMLCSPPPPYLLLVLLYSVVGGFGYQLVFSRMWKVLAKIFNARKEMFVIKFLHSCGQATSMLLLLVCLQLPWEGYVYGALLLLLAGIVLHLVPLTMLIAAEKGRLRNDQDVLVSLTEKGNESYYAHVATRAMPAQKPSEHAQQSSRAEAQADDSSSAPVAWKNPANFSAPQRDEDPRRYAPAETNLTLDDCALEYEDAALYRREGKCYNQDGVEILEMIVEEDEPAGDGSESVESEGRHASVSTTDETGSGAHSTDDNTHQSTSTKGAWYSQAGELLLTAFRATRDVDFRPTINRRLIGSTRSALADLRCCSCALLKATDTSVLVLFLCILPRLTVHHYQQPARARHMTLLAVVVISAAWAGASLLLLCCELRFRKLHGRLLVFGLFFQAFGYLCVYTTKSHFWTFVGCMLVGVGRSITCAYQETVIKRQLGQRRWATAKAGIGLLAGVCIILLAAFANLYYVYGPIDQLLLALLLIYSAAGALWIACSCRIFFI
uniref:Major facilitator superfamily associated domain-containing protein n=1 Tax=Anopheles epiroticus TaxID=199890 RepID=A0A182PPC8_9DIPT